MLTAPRKIPLSSVSVAENTSQLPFFARTANWVSRITGKPATFLWCCVLIVIWAVSGPYYHYSDTWQLIINTGTTIITFLMVFLIQNTQNREGAAIQAKLDELIRVTKAARNDLVAAEELSEEALMAIKREVGQNAVGNLQTDKSHNP